MPVSVTFVFSSDRFLRFAKRLKCTSPASDTWVLERSNDSRLVSKEILSRAASERMVSLNTIARGLHVPYPGGAIDAEECREDAALAPASAHRHRGGARTGVNRDSESGTGFAKDGAVGCWAECGVGATWRVARRGQGFLRQADCPISPMTSMHASGSSRTRRRRPVATPTADRSRRACAACAWSISCS